jgi:hypothetical protein
MAELPVRLRILVGTLTLILGLAIYGLAVMTFAVHLLPGNWIVQIIFYALAGIAWVWPAAWLTRWMQQAAPHRPPPLG